MLDDITGTSIFSVTLIGGVVLCLVLAARFARRFGKAEAVRDSLLEGERRRDAFDEESSRPLATGRGLIRRLRDRVGG